MGKYVNDAEKQQVTRDMRVLLSSNGSNKSNILS